MNYLISVIIPVYEVEKYISRCLDSVINQTYKNLEIIVVDDGTKDSSIDIIKQYLKKDSRIKLYRKVNGGLSDARNFGLSKAKGNFISFIDSDDFLELDMYETLIDNMLKNNADISVCDYYKIYEKTGKVSFNNEYMQSKMEILNSLDALNKLAENIIESHVWDKLFKKEICENLEFPIGKSYEDIYVMHNLFKKASRVVVTHIPKYYYNQRDFSICKTITLKNSIDYIEGFLTRFEEIGNSISTISRIKLFNIILNTYINQCQYKNFESKLKIQKIKIRDIEKKYKFNKFISKKNKVKIFLDKMGIKYRFQYLIYNKVKKLKNKTNI